MAVGLGTIGLMAVASLVGAPLVGWPAVVRLPAVLVPALVLATLLVRPWRWRESDIRAVDRWWARRLETRPIAAQKVGHLRA